MARPSRRDVTLGLAGLMTGAGPVAAWAASADAPAPPRPRIKAPPRPDLSPPIRAADPPPNTRAEPRPDPAYHAWVAGFRKRALAEGIAPATFERAFAGARYLHRVVTTDRAQSAPRRSFEATIAKMVSAEHVRRGRDMLKRNRALLDRIAKRYGVPAEVVAAIWGVETGYGAFRGETPVISALSSLAFENRRGAFFEAELLAALRILQAGDIAPGAMLGSWAGAMGHTQFMPSTYLAHAVDFDGDGRRDIWSGDPADALASAARYLAEAGWQAGGRWGLEVRLPKAGVALATRPVAEWRAEGVVPARGGALPEAGAAALILPNGAGGIAFLLYDNSRALWAYNASIKYAVGVGHLADRLAGGKGLVGGPGAELGFEDRQALQQRLTAAGYDTGGADGVFGTKTAEAIRAYQADQGLAQTGVATMALLARLGR